MFLKNEEETTMSILSLASGRSVYRGYEYYKQQRVLDIEKLDDEVFVGEVAGSEGACYEVTIDATHPRKSQCTCPHAAGRKIVCKHMVALYFSAYPLEEDRYLAELERRREEAEHQREEDEERLISHVRKMKKAELQETLLQLLTDGPEWQYERFLREIIEQEEGDDDIYIPILPD